MTAMTKRKDATGAHAPPPAPLESKKAKRRSAALRWTESLVEGGFTPISNFFLEYACELRPEITPGEVLFIIHLMFFKWDEKMPRPAYKTVAKHIGIGDAQARKLARQLQKKNYLVRHMRRSQPNRFDLQPLFTALESLRDRIIAKQEAAQAKRKPRRI